MPAGVPLVRQLWQRVKERMMMIGWGPVELPPAVLEGEEKEHDECLHMLRVRFASNVVLQLGEGEWARAMLQGVDVVH